ncbi:MAG TPA: aminotransferase class I/II-fold pyridoxal phosphate-dependent enzyme, partial [Candidatus Sulfotelmatobacter sp.]|nr:aminotransferase class I/II-fold pyridoxal phosphate-dependent enzyme [Candidatus Sulfotelmatobacter sp.]
APIFQTANFRGDSAEDFANRAGEARHSEFYTRYGNPTLSQVESVLAALEGSESALVTASGMGAVSAAVLSIVSKGDHVVAQSNHYGGTLNLLKSFLPRFGVEVTQVDQCDPAAFERAAKPNTRLMLLETPSNPVMTLTDLHSVAAISKARHITTLMDNTFATPLNQRPLDLGVDLVFHSATKYFGGHSDLIAGAIMGSAEWMLKIWNTHVMLGAALGPFDAWLMLRGLRTLGLRVRQHNENAMALAKFLEGHSAVKAVFYPGLKSHPQHDLAARQMSGFGGMLSFEVNGGYEAADRFLSRLRLASRAASLGGVESLAVHPASNFLHYMTMEEAARIGIAPGLLRISVGLEGKDDLIADFDQALR